MSRGGPATDVHNVSVEEAEAETAAFCSWFQLIYWEIVVFHPLEG